MRRTSVITLVLLLSSATARPCSIAVIPHELEESERGVDKVVPDAPAVEVAEITRGKGAKPGPDGGISLSSCDDIGMVTLRFTKKASDDRTPGSKIGYRFVPAGGTLPEGLELSPTAVREAGGTVMFHWGDGATDDQDPLEFAISVIAVDLAGNESAPSVAVWVRDRRERGAKE